MIRELYTMPAVVDFTLLNRQLAAVVTGLRGVNQVETSVAVYTDAAQDTAAVAAVVAAHVPPTYPPLDIGGRMATLSAVLHDDAQDWSNATGIPVAHLEHEALAWSLGGA